MTFRVKLLLALMALLPEWVMAQYNGVGLDLPQATFHIHSTEEYVQYLPPIPPGPLGGNSGDSTRDGILPPPPIIDDSTHYINTLLLTNTNTGISNQNGLLVKQLDKNVWIMQQEEGILNIQNGNSIIALTSSGVGVGETCGGYQFNVEGLSRFTQAVRMDSHVLTPLGELEAYINENSHLPGVPSADEVEKEGADLGEMNRLLMEKVEELTLYIIDLQKQIDALKSKTVK